MVDRFLLPLALDDSCLVNDYSLAEGDGWCWHVDACNSRNEQGVSYSDGNTSSWERSVSILFFYVIYSSYTWDHATKYLCFYFLVWRIQVHVIFLAENRQRAQFGCCSRWKGPHEWDQEALETIYSGRVHNFSGLYVISTNLMRIQILLSFFQTSVISGERSAGSSFREIHFHNQSSHLHRGRCCWGGHRNWNLPWMQEVGIHRSMNSHRKLSRYQLCSGPSESTSKMMNHHCSTI